MNSPDVGIPQALGDKVKYLAIRRPVRLVIPAFLFGDADPLTTCGRDNVNSGEIRTLYCLKGNPTIVGEKCE